MVSFTARTRKWGNSLGITIPQDVVRQTGISPDRQVTVIMPPDNTRLFERAFGTLRTERTTEEELDAIDREFE